MPCGGPYGLLGIIVSGDTEPGAASQVARMPKKPIKIEIVQEGDERFLLKVHADGVEERVPIVKVPRKPPRYRYRTVTLDKSKKKGF